MEKNNLDKIQDSDDNIKKKRRFQLALLGITISFIYVFCTTFFEIPKSGQRIADTVLGMIITGILGQIYSYYFSGKEKDDKEENEIN